MSKINMLFGVVAFGFITGCTTTESTKPKHQRQGDVVSKICFTQSIDGWQELRSEPNALILTKSATEAYKLDLAGGCDTRNATLGIALKSRTSCLSAGDEIIMSDGFAGRNSCRILKIHQWLPELKTKEVASE